MGEKAVTFDLDGTLVDLRAAYVRAHQQAAREVLDVDLVEARVLELMRTGLPIRAHMAMLDEAWPTGSSPSSWSATGSSAIASHARSRG